MSKDSLDDVDKIIVTLTMPVCCMVCMSPLTSNKCQCMSLKILRKMHAIFFIFLYKYMNNNM